MESGIPILLLYLFICPLWFGKQWMQREKHRNDQMTVSQWRTTAWLSGRCGSYRLVHVMITVPIPGGTNWTWHRPNRWGYISSQAQFVGILAGLAFPLTQLFRDRFIGSFEWLHGFDPNVDRVST